ncbi:MULTISPECIES: pilus assembly protein PilP [Pseudomonas]|uniref:pilus assembly protein PilP n=1 Tax=Pseudomonas guariconensis TaxID=1288410 RepID=UPI002097EF38|nr:MULTISPECIES: pilus assembly protein PilP [Pseudomonas]MCO7594705.1 pilus assembly protein PilP [Pseudomonas guariconensis]MCU7218558.1 pilus assembly protein PilP [Pseudomonas brassicacearum]
MIVASARGWLEAIGTSRVAMGATLVAVSLLVIALGWLVRLQGSDQAYRLGQARAHELDGMWQERALQARELASAEVALADAEHQLREARWRLSAGVGMSDLLDELASSGHAHGLIFEQLEVLDEVAQAGYRQVPLKHQVVGNYAALRAWLEEWLGQVRLLRVSGLRLARVDEPSGLLRLDLDVNAYHPGQVLPPPASLADEPARPAVQGAQADLFLPWSSRMASGGLARIPLAQLEMVGSLSRAGQHQALLWSAGRLYRVAPGDRLGRGDGVVVRVDRQQVEVRERLFLGGAWHERSTYLALSKPVGKEVRDERETAVDVGNGSDAADSGGIGDDLPG